MVGGSEKSRFVAGSVGRQAALLAADFRRGRLLGQKHRLDVRQDAALSDSHARQQLVELLVVADR